MSAKLNICLWTPCSCEDYWGQGFYPKKMRELSQPHQTDTARSLIWESEWEAHADSWHLLPRGQVLGAASMPWASLLLCGEPCCFTQTFQFWGRNQVEQDTPWAVWILGSSNQHILNKMVLLDLQSNQGFGQSYLRNKVLVFRMSFSVHLFPHITAGWGPPPPTKEGKASLWREQSRPWGSMEKQLLSTFSCEKSAILSTAWPCNHCALT